MNSTNSVTASICVLHDDNLASVSLDEAVKECGRAFGMWSEIKRLGAMDPYHEDGYLLNMLRNEILSLQQRILRICKARCWPEPEIALADLPPVMDAKYMVREQEYTEKADGVMRELLDSPVYKTYLEKNRNLSERGQEKLEPFAWVINQLKNGIEQKSPVMLQRALVNTLMSVGSALPASAGKFLEKLALILEGMNEEDYDNQLTLF